MRSPPLPSRVPLACFSPPPAYHAVMRVGCGLAGHKDADIAPRFRTAPLFRCSFPSAWRPSLAPRALAYAGIGARKTPRPS